MRLLFLLSVLVFSSCGGSLSSEQRKKIHENMEAGALKKISDAQLTEAALAYGRNIVKVIESSHGDKKSLDSLEKKYNVEIIFMQPGDKGLRLVERQIIEAYVGASRVDLTDNLQRMGKDSLLYTKPIVKERPDGSAEFSKVIGLRIPKKPVILSIKE